VSIRVCGLYCEGCERLRSGLARARESEVTIGKQEPVSGINRRRLNHESCRLFRSLLATALFCMSAAAKQKAPPAKPEPPPVPVFDVKLTPDPNLSIALPDNMLVLWTQCDDVGNPYADVMTLAQPFRQTVAFTRKGVVMFATNQMTDIPEPKWSGATPGPRYTLPCRSLRTCFVSW
jgi:hypothetical protein